MSPFDDGFVRFFRGLSRHNTRDWFAQHKAEYETHVKRPFEAFVEEAIGLLGAHDARLMGLTPRDVIFRLARDIRFSKDKTPFKLFMSAAIAPGGKKHMGPTGLFVRLGANGLGVAGGLYQPDKDALEAVRHAIAKDGVTLNRLVGAKAFRDRFGEIRGDRYKRLPPALRPAGERFPLLYHKQWYWWTDYPDPNIALRKDLTRFVLDHWKAGRRTAEWLERAVAS